MRTAASNTFKSPEFLAKLSKGQSTGIEVEVTDLETNNTTTYHAIRAAARALDIDKRYIEHYIYLKQDKPVLGRYVFKLLKSNSALHAASFNLEKINQKFSIKLEITDITSSDKRETKVYPSI